MPAKPYSRGAGSDGLIPCTPFRHHAPGHQEASHYREASLFSEGGEWVLTGFGSCHPLIFRITLPFFRPVSTYR